MNETSAVNAHQHIDLRQSSSRTESRQCQEDSIFDVAHQLASNLDNKLERELVTKLDNAIQACTHSSHDNRSRAFRLERMHNTGHTYQESQ